MSTYIRYRVAGQTITQIEQPDDKREVLVHLTDGSHIWIGVHPVSGSLIVLPQPKSPVNAPNDRDLAGEATERDAYLQRLRADITPEEAAEELGPDNLSTVDDYDAIDERYMLDQEQPDGF